MVDEVDEAVDDDDHRRRIIRLVVALSVIGEDPVPANTWQRIHALAYE